MVCLVVIFVPMLLDDEAAPELEKWYLRLPHLSAVTEVVRHANVSLNSEMEIIEALGREAASGRMLYWGACLAGEGPFDVILAHFGPVGALAAVFFVAPTRSFSSSDQLTPEEADALARRLDG